MTEHDVIKRPKPDGFSTVTPYLLVAGVERLLAFVHDAFDAEILVKKDRPDGTVMHAEVRIGDGMVMMGEPTPPFEARPGSIYLYVDDCDVAYPQALAAGGTSVMEVTSMDHAGQRYGGVRDPSGCVWWIATSIQSARSLAPSESVQLDPSDQ